MALTKILEPQDLQPGYNDVVIVIDSDNKNLPGFNYVMDLTFTSPTVNKTLRLRAQPRAVDGYGVFDISRIMQNYLSNENPLLLTTLEAQNSWLAYEADIYEEYITNEYESISIAEDIVEYPGFLVINTLAPVNTFNQGDFITIQTVEETPDVTFFNNQVYVVKDFESTNGIIVNIDYDTLLADSEVQAYITEHTTLDLVVTRILGVSKEIKLDTELNISDLFVFNGSERLDRFAVRGYNTTFPNPIINFNTQDAPPFYTWQKYRLSITDEQFGYDNTEIEFKDWIGYAMTTQKPLLELIDNNWYEQPTSYSTRVGQSRVLNFFVNNTKINYNIIFESYDESGTLIEKRKKPSISSIDFIKVNTGYWCAVGSTFVSGTNSDSFEIWNGSYQQFGNNPGFLVSDITPFSIGQQILIQVTPTSPAVAGVNIPVTITNISGNYIIISTSYAVFNNNVADWEIANGTTISGNVQYNLGNNFSDNADSYRIYFSTVANNNPVSQAYHYVIDREKFDYEEYQVYFLDRLGSIQSFSFLNKHKISFKVNKEQSGRVIGDIYDNNNPYWAQKDTDNSKPLLSINQEEELELTIAWMNDDESELFLDLLSSPIHYIRKVEDDESYTDYLDAKVVSYTLNKSSFNKKTLFQDDNNEYTLKFNKNNNEIINW